MMGTKLCWVMLVASLSGCAFDASEGVHGEELGEATQEVRRNALSNRQEATALKGFEALVQTQGSYQSLQPAYYDALSECISRVESALPH